MACVLRLSLVLVLVARSSTGLRLLEMRVPKFGDLYGSAVMGCSFDLQGARLYSVKWYKDEFEFFRFIPDSNPRPLALRVPAVTVDLSASNMSFIRLTQLQFNSSGVYKCEVSTEAPNFETVVGSGNMTVLALPHDGPIIDGVLPTYMVGNYVSANCTSARSYPPAVISWYINGIKVEPWFLEDHSRQQRADQEGLYTGSVALRFQLEGRHFRQPGKAVELRCSATVADQSWDRAVRPVLADPSNQKLAQEQLANHAEAVTLEKALPSFVVVVLFSTYWS